MRIVTVIGARPQFIKAAAVTRQLRQHAEVEEILVHTGQHYDPLMSEVFFEELAIPEPHFNLSIGSNTHGAQTGKMLESIEQVLLDVRPDWVLVYGDTNSTLAGALAAAKLHIPIAHVEAGLRSHNRQMPEELNRVLTDHMSNLLFAPTSIAFRNLQAEGIYSERIRVVGDVMFDALSFYEGRAETSSVVLETLGLMSKRYILSTIHRAENTDDPARLIEIFAALTKLAESAVVVMPLHPRTRSRLLEYKIDTRHVHLTDPVGYLDMVILEKHAKIILTDSGGVQKEAYFHKVPCITLRDETEWRELVDAGWNHLLRIEDLSRLGTLIEFALGNIPTVTEAFYGAGDASDRIVSELLTHTGDYP